jgi:hypothetical protein
MTENAKKQWEYYTNSSDTTDNINIGTLGFTQLVHFLLNSSSYMLNAMGFPIFLLSNEDNAYLYLLNINNIINNIMNAILLI